MSLILRIDVDRPYGRQPLGRHFLSRISSDYYFPPIERLGYLRELADVIKLLNGCNARAHVFFRRCTFPDAATMELIDRGRHGIGLHLEDSRSLETCRAEKLRLEAHVRRPVTVLTKHGSGGRRFGRHHHAPYEPDNYLAWSKALGFRCFLGNLEDPTLEPYRSGLGDVLVFPSAFWLEPAWRDTRRFTRDWLIAHARTGDVVLLLHPENVLACAGLTFDLRHLVNTLETRLLE